MENVASSTSYQRTVNPRATLIENEFFHASNTNHVSRQATYRPSQGCSTAGPMEGKAACYAKYRALLESKGNHYNNGLRRNWHEENVHMQFILATMGSSRQPGNSQQQISGDTDGRKESEMLSNVKLEHAISPCDNLVPLNASTPSCGRTASSVLGQTDRSSIANLHRSSVASSSISVNSYLQSSGSISTRQDTSYSSNVNSIDSNRSFTSQVSGDLPSNASLASIINNSAVSFENPSVSASSIMHSSIPVSSSISPHSMTSQISVRSSLVNSACSSPHSIPTSSNFAVSNCTDELLDFELPDDLKNVNDDLFNYVSVSNGALDLSISKLSDATDDLLNDLDPSMHTSSDENYINLFSP